jgi:hypothetical protein
MPTQKTVSELALALHDKKILNIDATLRDALATPSSILNNPDKAADWNVIGGSHYVLVTGLRGDVGQVTNPANIARTTTRGGGTPGP